MTGKAILKELTAYKQGMQTKEVKEAYQLDRIVKLASNENPYHYSEKVTQALESFDPSFYLYPDGYATELRNSLADFYEIQADQLVFGSGSDELITFICRAFLSEGTNTVMASPTFPQYRHHALIEGAEVRGIPTLTNGAHDLEKMAEAVDDQTKVIWVCNPDNPTGRLIPYAEFEAFMRKIPSNVLVVLDEAYYEFVDPELRYPFKEILHKYSNVVMLRTFSKIYGLASLRVGYAITNEAIANQLNVVRGPFNTTTLGQYLCRFAIEDQAFVEQTRLKNKQVRQSFEQFLQSVGWQYYESHTNFILVKTPIDADEIAEYLLSKGFIVRSGNLLGYPNTIRITIGLEADMLALQEKVQQFIQERK